MMKSIIILAVVMSTGTVMDRAAHYLPMLYQLECRHWRGMPLPEIPAGQIEQESSWKEHAELKTSREHGMGLTQITIAYNKNGTERFNNFKEAIKLPRLKGWDWQDDPFNARYQITYLILQDHSNFNRMRPMFVDDTETWRAALVSYNAGPGRVLLRRSYAKAKGMIADRWENGLDVAHTQAEDAILYGRPLWEAVNEYPRTIFEKSKKYRKEI